MTRLYVSAQNGERNWKYISLYTGLRKRGKHAVGIDLKELGERSDVEMFEILPRVWNLKLIFTQEWASVDMNWGWTPRQFQPGQTLLVFN